MKSQSTVTNLTPTTFKRGSTLAIIWTVLFGVNLIVPGIFAVGEVHGPGWLAVTFGCALYYGGGLYLVIRRRPPYQSLLWGAGLVGLSQLLPLVQFFAGCIALEAWDVFANSMPSEERFTYSSPAWAFFMTMATGAQLAFVAIGSGAMFQSTAHDFKANATLPSAQKKQENQGQS